LVTPPKLHFCFILETKLHRSPQGSHLFIKTKNATVYSFKIFLNGKGRILLPEVTILEPVVMILAPAVTILLPAVTILVAAIAILLPVVMILVAAVTIYHAHLEFSTIHLKCF
jgi:hypothetical protein